MATRSALTRLGLTRSVEASQIGLTRSLDSARAATRCFSDDKGRVLSEEERAKENIYIQKMERERLEKLKKKIDTGKPENEKGTADKKPEETKP
ncbi:PREDICTED: uncharacterized protein At2g27730, mitochondrial [Tarenaya hassleriana]|uniref:uncharacterized protein At2g27730, mitochondrial n=1 Tax=Tarenaya hassleriana TaxID=28532 RepID=UPI00053C1DFF|nr:PREDICTED: uncharacterized protein At2g27730, mitochondrial [Tarenaya hassleriana]